VVLLPLTDMPLLPHAYIVVAASEDQDAESGCDFATIGFASVVDVSGGVCGVVRYNVIRFADKTGD
jgi:hypothetical protein